MRFTVRENMTTKTMEILKDGFVEYELDIEYALDLAWVINNFIRYPLARDKVKNLPEPKKESLNKCFPLPIGKRKIK